MAGDATADVGELTCDAVLGGRLRLFQPRRGHRVGHDAILLAAACPAQPGDHVVDFGAGVGAAGLAVARRLAGTRVTLVEIDAGLAALAARNVALNGLEGRVAVVIADVGGPLPFGDTDHVVMNPPFNDARRLQASPDAARRAAHVAGAGLLLRWLRAAAAVLRDGGTATIIWRADDMPDAVDAMAESFGRVAVTPVQPAPGREPIRIVATGVRGGDAAMRFTAPLVLQDERARPSSDAEAILRHAQALARPD